MSSAPQPTVPNELEAGKAPEPVRTLCTAEEYSYNSAAHFHFNSISSTDFVQVALAGTRNLPD